MKTMIVEDDRDMMTVLQYVATNMLKVEVEKVKDGESLIAQIEAGNIPNLVLLDLHLPGISGEDVFLFLREKTDSKIIIVTADVRAAQDFIKNHNADAIFVKPFSLDELALKISSLLQ